MKTNAEKPNQILDRAITEMRNTPISADQVEQAAARVLATLNAEHSKVIVHPAVAQAEGSERIRDCSGYQSLIPAYLSSSLTPSRKLLFEDHVRECVACRKALDQARQNATGSSSQGQVRRFRSRRVLPIRPRWAVAAAVLLAVAITAREPIRDFIWPIDVHAIAQTVDGGLYRVSGQEIRPVVAGERIDRRQAVRTGNASGAVLVLADGSKIEMNSRSELQLDRAGDGVSIKLDRGSVIVTAAKQRNGHLYVATTDCTVSVVGTVFSVNSGIKGSRVSVIEGEVHVQQGSATQALLPGQQLATGAAMGSVPVSDEISWSRDKDLHFAMLKEFVAFGEDLGRRLGNQEMRHSSNLAGLVPADTLVFVSLPNVTEPLSASYAAMKQRISQNSSLQQWWTSNTVHGGTSVDDMVGRLTRVTGSLGPEVVISVPVGGNNRGPLLLAAVTNKAALTSELAQLPADKDLAIHVSDTLLIVSSDNALAQRILTGSSSGFAATELGQRVAQAYQEGVGWLLAADLQQIVKNAGTAEVIGDVKQLVVEQRTGSGGASYRAVLGFNQARNGMAAWLASPGAIGAIEFVSPQAYGAAAIVTRDPALILDDIFAFVQKNPSAWSELQEAQRQHGIDIRYDFAQTLGNEFLVTVDGPILPTPAWKFVMEVNDLNREASARQKAGITLSTEVVGGKAFYSLKSADFPVEVHYTFWAGYMIIAPNRAMLDDAIRYHDTGSSLARSDSFRSEFPADGLDHASGFVFQNLNAIAKAIPVPAIQNAFEGTVPTLVCLYGETDRVTMSSKGVLGVNVANMAGLAGMLSAVGLK